jgi:hypothetical protein
VEIKVPPLQLWCHQCQPHCLNMTSLSHCNSLADCNNWRSFLHKEHCCYLEVAETASVFDCLVRCYCCCCHSDCSWSYSYWFGNCFRQDLKRNEMRICISYWDIQAFCVVFFERVWNECFSEYNDIVVLKVNDLQ